MAQKCTHKGCEKKFTDPEEECHYHPGAPIFHEGQKGMSKLRSIPNGLTLTETQAGNAANLESVSHHIAVSSAIPNQHRY